MKVTCPSCETNFTVPEAALGARGRILRCARCGHKWHQLPPGVEAEPPPSPPVEAPRPENTVAVAVADSPPSEPSAVDSGAADQEAADEVVDKEFEEPAAPPGFNLTLGDESASFSFGPPDPAADHPGEAGESPSAPPAEDGDSLARIAEMMGAPPGPIPDVFTPPPPEPRPRRKGGGGLWLLVILILLGGAGFGLYELQEIVVDLVPGSADVYQRLGLRNEVVGAGLIFRNYSSERMVQENSELLVVRGVIANTTDAAKEIPLLRLALYNDKALLQKKIISPPQQTLDARGSVGFRITLEQPDPTANRFEVTFASARGPEPAGSVPTQTAPVPAPEPAGPAAEAPAK